MKFCSITPVKNASLMFEEEAVMLLAHLAEKHEDYSAIAAASEKYKIMDNSIVELGGAFSMRRLVEQAEKCKADEIILPDVFENGPLTIERAIKSIKWLKRKGLLKKYKLMAVCHGKSRKEFAACFKLLELIPEVGVIGIPKITQKWCGERRSLFEIFKNSDKEIHFLGCYDSLEEIRGLKSDLSVFSKVRSLDTCLPSLLALEGKGCWESREGKTIDLEHSFIEGEVLEEYRKTMKQIREELDGGR